MEPPDEPARPAARSSDVSYTHVIYLLHAISVVVGILTAASIVGKFLFSLPSIIAVLMNYARRSRVRGTWLESHFHWQLRTFWWSLAWMLLVYLLFGWLVLFWIGTPLISAGAFLVGVWVVSRVIRGWLALRDGRSMAG